MGRPFGDFPVIFVLRCTNSCGLRFAVFFRVSTTKSHNGTWHDSTVEHHAIYPCQVLGDGVREILPYPCPAGTSNRETWERLIGRNANIHSLWTNVSSSFTERKYFRNDMEWFNWKLDTKYQVWTWRPRILQPSSWRTERHDFRTILDCITKVIFHNLPPPPRLSLHADAKTIKWL